MAQKMLRGMGVKNMIVVPVGLDLFQADYETACVSRLKKYDYHEADKVLLFIGRMIDKSNW